jgi:hypothetical protein
MYLTNGSLPQDLVPYIEELKRATGRAIENCAFVQSAWITEPARQDRLYPALTGRMMREIFEDFDQDFALAYYRESPSPNTAIDAHKAMGWQILDFTTTDVFNFPINIAPPTEPESGYRKDENRFREALIDFQGGLTRRYLLYTREMWQQKRDELLNAPHTFIDEDEHFVFRH